MTTVQVQEFGERLREIREERSLSMKQLAGRSGVSLSALGRYERGKRFPGLDSAVLLAEALDVPVDYLATGRGPKHSLPPATARIEEALAAIESMPSTVRKTLAALFLPERNERSLQGDSR